MALSLVQTKIPKLQDYFNYQAIEMKYVKCLSEIPP